MALAVVVASNRLHAIMADAPLAAARKTEEAGGSKKEPALAPHPWFSIRPKDAAQPRLDLAAVGIEIGKPVHRSAPVMVTAPAPLPLYLEQIGILPDQKMTWHHPAGEEVLCDPVRLIFAFKQIGAGRVGEDMHEEAPLRR